MKRYDVIFISAALLCLILGEGLGMWMGKTGDFTFAPAHAHLNLVGWVTLVAYGLIHRAYPALAASRLAAVQCVLAVVGALVLPFGIGYVLITSDPIIALVGSVIVFAATLLFGTMFIRRSAMAAPA